MTNRMDGLQLRKEAQRQLTDHEGRLAAQPSADRPYRIPDEVWLFNEGLAWTAGPELLGRDMSAVQQGGDLHAQFESLMDVALQRAHPTRSLLPKFLELECAAPKRIQSFARRWGILGICEHGLPSSHDAAAVGTSAAWLNWCDVAVSAPLDADWICGWEPLSAWRWWARKASATVAIAGLVLRGQIAPLGLWQRAAVHMAPGSQPIRGIHAECPALEYLRLTETRRPQMSEEEQRWRQRAALAWLLDEWLLIGGVRPRCDPGRGGPRISFGGGGLAGSLALQLVQACSSTGAFALCSECGSSYLPSRLPRRDQRNYCPGCKGKKIPERNAARSFRQRERDKESDQHTP